MNIKAALAHVEEMAKHLEYDIAAEAKKLWAALRDELKRLEGYADPNGHISVAPTVPPTLAETAPPPNAVDTAIADVEAREPNPTTPLPGTSDGTEPTSASSAQVTPPVPTTVAPDTASAAAPGADAPSAVDQA